MAAGWGELPWRTENGPKMSYTTKRDGKKDAEAEKIFGCVKLDASIFDGARR
jgi:hypothetical protein